MTSLFAEYAPHAESVRDERVTIREATAADVPALVAIDATRGAQRQDHEERVRAQVADRITHSLVAILDDEVIGWTTAMWWCGNTDAPDGFYVSGITVLPEQRRKGAGERLLEALLRWVWARSDSVWSVVNARNAASITLHERAGFREVGRGPELAGVTFTGGSGLLLLARRGDEVPERSSRPARAAAAEHEVCLDQIEAAADGVVDHVRSAIMRA